MWSSFAVSCQLDPLSNIYFNTEMISYLLYVNSNKTYPATLPTLSPPKTNPTARDRSSNGIVLQMELEKSNQVEKIIYASSLIRHNLQYRKHNSDSIRYCIVKPQKQDLNHIIHPSSTSHRVTKNSNQLLTQWTRCT